MSSSAAMNSWKGSKRESSAGRGEFRDEEDILARIVATALRMMSSMEKTLMFLGNLV